MTNLKVKLEPMGKAPTIGSENAAGYDCYAHLIGRTVHLAPGMRSPIPLGFSAQWDDARYYARLAPRSGLAFHFGIHVLAGVIDPDYRDVWQAILLNTGIKPLVINHGDKIVQAVFERFKRWDEVEVVDSLTETVRGTSGFGSTGTR